jgi:hypothetical protein
VAFDDGESAYDLKFSAPSAAPLVLPDRFQKAIQYYTRANTIAQHL